MKRYITSIVCVLINYASFCQENVVSMFGDYHTKNPIEKIYVSTDKQVYTIGEDIYYKIFLVEGTHHKATNLSSVAYVELIRNDEILFDQVLKVQNGRSNGNILLPDTLESGKYVIRAYTLYQLKFGNQFIFSKEIEIKSPAMNLNYLKKDGGTFDFQIFPEGGHIVSSIPNTIGFKCVNSKGIGVTVKGILMTETDSIIAFSSSHRGMGKFNFTPEEGIKYYIKYTVADEIFEFKISDIKKQGYGMSLIKGRKEARLIINSSSTELDFKNTFVLAQARGQFLATLYPTEETNFIHYKIPYTQFPTGVIQLTLFKNDVPILERIYFNENPLLEIQIRQKKEKLVSDSIVIHKLALSNDSIVLNGHASVSVLQRGSNTPTINIKSHLLLASDIRGSIENSEYYFNDQYPKRGQKLDLLMLTQGWRSYDWDEILNNKSTSPKIEPQNGLSISGTIRSIKKNTGVPRKASLFVMDNYEFEHQFNSNSNGFFEINNLDIQDSVSLIVQAMKEKRVKGEKINIRDEGVYIVMSDPKKPKKFITRNIFIEESSSDIQTSEFDITQLENVRMLEDVVVTANRQDKFQREEMFYSVPDKRVIIDTTARKDLVYSSILDVIQSEIPGITTGSPGPMDAPQPLILYRGSKLKFLLDGVIIDQSQLDFITPFEIDFVDISTSVYALSLYKSPVLMLYSKEGYLEKKSSLKGSVTIDITGYHKAKKFYTPKYKQLSRNYLSTIFWNPNASLENGNIQLSFPNYALDSDYVVFLEGITNSGHPFFYQFKDRFKTN
ncbi:MAG: hypothetical protein AB8B73_05865 [Ekhidna sp.]